MKSTGCYSINFNDAHNVPAAPAPKEVVCTKANSEVNKRPAIDNKHFTKLLNYLLPSPDFFFTVKLLPDLSCTTLHCSEKSAPAPAALLQSGWCQGIWAAGLTQPSQQEGEPRSQKAAGTQVWQHVGEYCVWCRPGCRTLPAMGPGTPTDRASGRPWPPPPSPHTGTASPGSPGAPPRQALTQPISPHWGSQDCRPDKRTPPLPPLPGAMARGMGRP